MSRNFKVFAYQAMALGIAGVSLVGCEASVLALEVLPPRTSASCSAPVASAPSYARGLFDVQAYGDLASSYEADLRMTARADLVTDEIEVTISDEDGGDVGVESYHVSIGDVPLLGEDDDLRTALVENVRLLSRTAIEDMLDGTIGSGISDTEQRTILIKMTPRAEGFPIGDPSTFTLDVCDGCLLERPADEACEEPEVVTANSVCRPGQDAESYSCATPSSGGVFGG